MTNWLIHKSPVYYGWVIMATGTLGVIMTSPGQSYIVSVFTEHFINDLAISRSLVSTLYTGATLAGSFALPFVGRLIDKHGARKIVLVVSLAFGLACIYMGQVQNAIMLGFGFVAIRFLGQGSLGLVSMNVINQWWIERRGLVMGISGLCMSLLGLGLFPIAVNFLIQDAGWRYTYGVLGFILLLVMAPVGYIFFRDRPEQVGLLPDGRKEVVEESTSKTEVAPEDNWTLKEAMGTAAFWVVAGSAGTISMITTGLIFHLVSIFNDQGLDANTAASVFVPLSITMAAVNLGGGILADKIPVRGILISSLFCMAAALFLAIQLKSYWFVIAFGVAMGATSGFYRVIMSVMWANYFGRLHLGSIMGTAQTIAIAGSALGPMPFGIARDLAGSYEAILLWSITIPMFFVVANLFAGRPRRA
ncbi:MAG: MFS transporter [Rhodothermales bacterium]